MNPTFENFLNMERNPLEEDIARGSALIADLKKRQAAEEAIDNPDENQSKYWAKRAAMDHAHLTANRLANPQENMQPIRTDFGASALGIEWDGLPVVPTFLRNLLPEGVGNAGEDFTVGAGRGAVGLWDMLNKVDHYAKAGAMELLPDFAKPAATWLYKASSGGYDPEYVADYLNNADEEYKAWRTEMAAGNSMAGIIGEMVGEAAPTLIAPLSLGTTAVGRITSGAVINSAVAGGTTYSVTPEDTLYYMLLGGVAGGALAGVVHALGRGGVDLIKRSGAYGTEEVFRPLQQAEVADAFKAAGLPAPKETRLKTLTDGMNAELEGHARMVAKRRGEINAIVDSNMRADALRDGALRPITEMSATELRQHKLTSNLLLSYDRADVADWLDFLGRDLDFTSLTKRIVARKALSDVDQGLSGSAASAKQVDDGLIELTKMEQEARAINEVRKARGLGSEDILPEKPRPTDRRKLTKKQKDEDAAWARKGLEERLGRTLDFESAEGTKAALKEAQEDAMWQLRELEEGVQQGSWASEMAKPYIDRLRGLMTRQTQARDALRQAENGQGNLQKAIDDYRSSTIKLARESLSARGLEGASVPTADEVGDVIQAASTGNPVLATRAATAAAEEVGARVKNTRLALKQGGAASTELLLHLTRGGIGGAIGAAVNEDNPEIGFLMGALLGAAGWPAAMRYGRARLKNALIKQANKRNIQGAAREAYLKKGDQAFSLMAGKYWQQPRDAMRRLGTHGQFIANNIEFARTAAENKIGTALTKVRQILLDHDILEKGIFGRLKAKDAGQLRAFMEKRLPNAPANVREAGIAMQNAFKDVLKVAREAGALTDDEFKGLWNNLTEKGYWPRVYDRPYLASEEGRQKFIQTLASENFTRDEATQIIKALIGEDSRYVKKLLEDAKKGNTYRFDRHVSDELLTRITSRDVIGRSTHLGHTRKLFKKGSDLLDEFVVDDPMQVLTQYFDDVFRNIENIRHFGRKDEHFADAVQLIAKEYGPDEAKYAAQFYYHNVGDPRANAIKAAIEMSDATVTMLGKASAWANLHLWAAQIINSMQAGVFGAAYLAKHGGKGFKAVLGGLSDQIFNPTVKVGGIEMPAREFAAASGADLETVMMNYLGEQSVMNHYLFGNKATDFVHKSIANENNPLRFIYDSLNDPSQFLRTIGFTSVEKFQRQWAAQIGRRMTDDLLKGKDALLRQGYSRSSPQIKKLNATLKELGLPETATLNSVTEDSYLTAGLSLSNIVNFRNTADRIPLVWQMPHMAPFKRFKTFAYHTQDFLWKEYKKGNIAGLLTYFGLGSTAGVAMYEGRERLKAGITGNEKRIKTMNQESGAMKIIQGVATIGGLGLVLDSLLRARDGTDLLTTAAGPAISDAFNIATGVTNSLVSMDPEIAYNEFVKSAPEPLALPISKVDEAITGSDPRQPKKSSSGFGGF